MNNREKIIMKKNIVKALSAIFGLTLLTASLAGCGSVKAVQANAAGTADTVNKEINEEKAPAAVATEDPVEKTKIKVHVSQGPAPYLYITDDGSPAGFDFAVFQEAISRLPQYEPEYIPASDGLTGVIAGLYDLTVGNWAWREERGESYYYSYPVKITDKAFVQREGDEPLKDLHDAAARGYKVIAGASDAAFEKWNREHPDEQIELVYSDGDFIVRYQQVADGLADFTLDDGPIISHYFEEFQFEGIKKVTMDSEALQDILPTVNTYFLFPKDENGKKLRDDINTAIKELYEDGTLEKLSIEYFGYPTTPAAESYDKTIN